MSRCRPAGLVCLTTLVASGFISPLAQADFSYTMNRKATAGLLAPMASALGGGTKIYRR